MNLVMLDQRLMKLEELTEQLEDIVINMQKIADIRHGKLDANYTQLANIAEMLQQQLDNTHDKGKQIDISFNNIHTKLHVISNHIMSLGNSIEELAEYINLLETEQNLIKAKLDIPNTDA